MAGGDHGSNTGPPTLESGTSTNKATTAQVMHIALILEHRVCYSRCQLETSRALQEHNLYCGLHEMATGTKACMIWAILLKYLCKPQIIASNGSPKAKSSPVTGFLFDHVTTCLFYFVPFYRTGVLTARVHFPCMQCSNSEYFQAGVGIMRQDR